MPPAPHTAAEQYTLAAITVIGGILVCIIGAMIKDYYERRQSDKEREDSLQAMVTEQLRIVLGSNNDRISELEKKVALLQTSLDAAETARKIAEGGLTITSIQLAEAQAELLTATKRIGTLRDDIANHVGTVEQQKARIATMEGEANDLRQRISDLTSVPPVGTVTADIHISGPVTQTDPAEKPA